MADGDGARVLRVCFCTQRQSAVDRSTCSLFSQPTRQQQLTGLLHGDTFFLDTFAVRQWDDPNYSGTRLACDKRDFVRRVHEHFKAGGGVLVDGYAPFCKHVFVPNFAGAKLGALAITDQNRGLLRSGYSRRRPDELAVLTRCGRRLLCLLCAATFVIAFACAFVW
jgi:hypothetical protein